MLPPGLDRLRRLVTLLVVTMIGGFLVIVTLFVIRLGTPGAALPDLGLPQSVQLPEGAKPEAITLARRWVLVLSTDQRLFLYDRETGALQHEMALPN